MGKAKRTLSVIMAALMLVFTCMTYVPASAAEVTANAPAVAFVGVDHSPLVVGDTETFSFTTSNADSVQYKAILKDAKGTVVEDVTNGYTAAVAGNAPYVVKAKTTFALGKYTLTVYAKRVSDGKEVSYDAALNCVNKDDANRVYANGDMVLDKTTVPAGQKITVTGINGLAGIAGPYKYRLHVYNATTGVWTKNVVATYGDKVEWTPTTPGTYVLDVHVNTEKSTTWAKYLANPTSTDVYGTYEAWKLQTVIVTPAVLAIDSVKAVSAKEIVVDFNKTVDEFTAETAANYVLYKNNVTTAGSALALTAAVDDTDSSKVVLTLANPLQNGDVVSGKVLKTVLDDSLKGMDADYSVALPMFGDTTAPSLLGAKVSGTNLVLSFDDFINAAALTKASYVIKVDGVRVLDGNVAVSGRDITLNGTDYSTLTVGNHSVVAYGVTDLAGNVASFLSYTLAITTDTTVPAFSSIKAKSTNSFEVTFNKAVVGTPTFVVKKNGYALAAVNPLTDVATVDHKTFTVTVHDNGLILIYGTNETTANLSVEITGIKDANNTIGSPATTSVVLTKDTAGPYMISSNNGVAVSGTSLLVQFNEALVAGTGSVIVTDKDGIRIAPLNTTIVNDLRYGNNTVLSINFGTLAVGTYTVNIPAGFVVDASANDCAATTTTITKSGSTATVSATVNPLTGISATNEITVEYGLDMTNSATNLANYKLDNQPLPSGTIAYFDGDLQTVVIQLPATVAVATDYVLTLSDSIVSTTGAKVTDSNKNIVVALNDVVGPTLVSAKKLSATTVELTFSEALKTGSIPADTTWADDFVVKVNGVEIAASALTAGSAANKVVLTVTAYNIYQGLTVTVGKTGTTYNTMDANNNLVVKGTTVTATN